MNLSVTRAGRTINRAMVTSMLLTAVAAYLLLAVAVYGNELGKVVTLKKHAKPDIETLACDFGEVQAAALPDPTGRYLYSEQYGWFDNQHFHSGYPDQIIEDVRAAGSSGGGHVSIRQPVRDGLTGFTAHYLVAGNLTEDEVVGVSLGIYMDWSRRFEAWQGRVPRSLVGPLTAFAIEDLPSHYLGFFAAAKGLEIAEIFHCYLGGVEVTDMAPPHVLLTGESEPGEIGVPLKRLTNEKFVPLVLTEAGWQHVPWPVRLRLLPVDESSGLWAFEQEETWYFNGG